MSLAFEYEYAYEYEYDAERLARRSYSYSYSYAYSKTPGLELSSDIQSSVNTRLSTPRCPALARRGKRRACGGGRE